MSEEIAKSSAVPRKPFNWRLYWLLLGLNAAGSLAMIPFSLSLASSHPSLQNADASPMQIFIGVALTQVIYALVSGLLIAVGLLLATRTGLGAPFLSGQRDRSSTSVKTLWRPALIVGAALPIANLLIIISTRVLGDKTPDLGFFPHSTTIAPRWQLILSGISAGITEEILFRLFLFSLFAWLGSRIVRSLQSPPKKPVLWIANFLSAVLFGLYHLSTADLNVIASVLRSIGLNSLGGLAFGYLFGFYGLESAMIAHAVADILFYVVAPYFISF